MNTPSRWAALLAVLASGTLFALSLDIGPIGLLVLVAPIPVLLFALSNAPTWAVFVVAVLARMLGATGFVYAYAGALPIPVLVIAPLLLGIEFAIVVSLTCAAARRLPPWVATLSFAVFVTALEFLSQTVSPHGTYGAIGYSLIDARVLIQVASLGGIAAVTFVAALVPMAIAMLVKGIAPRQVIWVSAVPIALVVAYGLWRLSQPYSGEAKVALASIDSLVMHAARDEKQALPVARAYANVLRSLPRSNLDAIVLPERMFADARDQVGAASQPLQDVATEMNTSVIAGFDEVSANGTHRNTARVFSPVAALQSYTKRRLIPGLESELTPGRDPLIIADRGVAICKDLDFAPMIREYGQRNVRILFAPAWDFVTDGRMHSRMAVMRGVENGFAVARAASLGRLTVSDAFGRVVGEATTSDREPVTLVATVGLIAHSTLYARVGDCFAWMCVACAIGLLGWLVAKRVVRRVASAKMPSHCAASSV